MTGIMQPRDLEWQRQPVIEGFGLWRGSLGVPLRDFIGGNMRNEHGIVAMPLGTHKHGEP